MPDDGESREGIPTAASQGVSKILRSNHCEVSNEGSSCRFQGKHDHVSAFMLTSNPLELWH